MQTVGVPCDHHTYATRPNVGQESLVLGPPPSAIGGHVVVDVELDRIARESAPLAEWSAVGLLTSNAKAGALAVI